MIYARFGLHSDVYVYCGTDNVFVVHVAKYRLGSKSPAPVPPKSLDEESMKAYADAVKAWHDQCSLTLYTGVYASRIFEYRTVEELRAGLAEIQAAGHLVPEIEGIA